MQKIGWVLPDGEYSAGSGGLKTVLDHIACIANDYQQEIYVNTLKSAEFVYNILKTYPNIRIASSYKAIEKDLDLLIATHSLTAKIVRDIPASKKAYFVQDLEFNFYPMGDNHIKAMESYKYGLTNITMGRYLADSFEKINQKAYPIDFCVDKNTYKPLGAEKKKAICFLHQPEKAWRCSETGLEALFYLKQQMPDLTIYLYGSSVEVDYDSFINLGLLSFEDCNKLYNVCQLGVCFSTTNPSRIPFEMMAAGLPVLDLSIENKQDFPENLLWLSGFEHIDSSIIAALCSPEALKERSLAGLEFMKDRDLTLAYDQFKTAITEILAVQDEQN